MPDKKKQTDAEAPLIVATLDAVFPLPSNVSGEALAGALPDWDLVPEAPFLRRR
jgi:hypothetical protein